MKLIKVIIYTFILIFINSNIHITNAQENTPTFEPKQHLQHEEESKKEQLTTITVTEIPKSCTKEENEQQHHEHNHFFHSHNHESMTETAKEGAIWFIIFTILHVLMHLVLGFLGAYAFVGTRDKIRKKKHTHFHPYIHTCNDNNENNNE